MATLRRKYAQAAGYLRVAAFAPVVIGCIYLLFWLPTAPAIAVISATVESLSFEVSVPEIVQLRIDGFSLFYEQPDIFDLMPSERNFVAQSRARTPLCMSGILIPQTGSLVTYKRLGKASPSIVIQRSDNQPAALFELTKGTLPEQARRSSWVRLEAQVEPEDSTKVRCPGTVITMLPIYGITHLGTEMQPAGSGTEFSPGLLISGTVEIFAKTIDPRALAEGATRIYPASKSSIALPPGAKIAQYLDDADRLQPWAGFAITNSESALEAKVSTSASKLALYRPGAGMKPEVLSIGLFTQLIHDPILVWAQVVIAFLFSTMQMLSSAFATLSSESQQADKGRKVSARVRFQRRSKRIPWKRN